MYFHFYTLLHWQYFPVSPPLWQALSERLFYYIAVSLLPHNTLCELEAAVESGRALSPILQWHKHPNDYFSREAQTLYFNSLRTYWQELIDLTRSADNSRLSIHNSKNAGFFLNSSEATMLLTAGGAFTWQVFWLLLTFEAGFICTL